MMHDRVSPAVHIIIPLHLTPLPHPSVRVNPFTSAELINFGRREIVSIQNTRNYRIACKSNGNNGTVNIFYADNEAARR